MVTKTTPAPEGATAAKAEKPQPSAHERKFARIAKQMGTNHAAHLASTFKPGILMGSKVLAEFRARREAERLGWLPVAATPVPAERFEINADTNKVTQIAGRKTRKAS